MKSKFEAGRDGLEVYAQWSKVKLSADLHRMLVGFEWGTAGLAVSVGPFYVQVNWKGDGGWWYQ